jgi:O-antigen/teichoic acid export membrane protein
MAAEQEDLTGRKQLGWNVAVTTLGQVVVVISGFIIPRLIDRQLDQASLGIWDFGWSTVSYFRFLGLGLAGGLNRYVAYYRSREAHQELKRAVSSTSLLQLSVAAATMLAAVLVAYGAEWIFDEESLELAAAARWLIILLGAGLAVKMLCWPARGVLTGHHRWATTAAVTACGDILLLGVMVTILYTGGGLPALGSAFLVTTLITEGLRTYYARKVYGGRFLVWSAIDRQMMKKMLVFGIKTNLGSLPVLLVMQTVSILLASTSGPAALALYARPLSLTRHAQTIVARFAQILTSTAASLQGLGQEAEIRRFFLASTQSAFSITLPLLLTVALYGDVIVRVWMGADYVDPLLAPLFAAGLLLPYANSVAMRVLVGMNAHGRVGLISLLVSSIMLAVGIAVAFAIGWTPRVAAVIASVSLSVGPGLIVPLSTCRRLNVRILDYVREVFWLPLVCNVAFAGILALPRLHTAEPSVAESLAALVAGSAVLAALYWVWLLEPSTKEDLLARLRIRYRPATASGD